MSIDANMNVMPVTIFSLFCGNSLTDSYDEMNYLYDRITYLCTKIHVEYFSALQYTLFNVMIKYHMNNYSDSSQQLKNSPLYLGSM